MTEWIQEGLLFTELKNLDSEIAELARPFDGTAAMLEKLIAKYPESQINESANDLLVSYIAKEGVTTRR